jgi:drug/metabolite transporter (DMT)-like permease
MPTNFESVKATPYLFVLVASVLHAYWNYLLKRSGGGQLFVGLSKVAEVALFAPVFALVGLREATSHGLQLWPLALVGAALTLSNYVLLAKAYERADLSFVYPISRGGVLIFVPVLGYFAFSERLNASGFAAVGSILAGIVVMQLPSGRRQAPGRPRVPAGAVILALLAGLAAAGYTIWDKRAVRSLSPFTYFYTYTTVVGAAYGTYLVRAYGGDAIRDEWRRNAAAIVQVAAFNTLAYVLVLFALRDGVSSYVVAVRQLSVAFGALLGWRLLGERIEPPKRLGIALIVAGAVLVALTR